MNKESIYKQVTEKIIEALKQDLIPWQRPWNAHQCMDRNAVSGRPYKGVNVLLLNLSAMANGFASPYWLTFLEAKKLGGHVKAGEKGTSIVFWKVLEVEQKDAQGNVVIDPNTGDPVVREVPFARWYVVFNFEQTEGVRLPEKFAFQEPVSDGITQALFELPIVKWGKKSCYHPDRDFIEIPPLKAFQDEDDFWSTFFHELIHWTAKRVHRDLTGRFGDSAYAMEELVAEIGSAFLCSLTGIFVDTLRHASYVNAWIEVLERDSRAIFTASRKAQEAVDWLVDHVTATAKEAA